jgi:predicted nucleic acid-binding protein
MFLVDTNVLSEATRKSPSPSVLRWLSTQPQVLVSAVSVLELEFGISRLEASAKRTRLTQWLEGLLSSPAFEVVAIEAAVARAAGRLKARVEAGGRPRPELDLLIAATAQVRGAVVATRNTQDFDGLGVAVFDPFSAP